MANYWDSLQTPHIRSEDNMSEDNAGKISTSRCSHTAGAHHCSTDTMGSCKISRHNYRSDEKIHDEKIHDPARVPGIVP